MLSRSTRTKRARSLRRGETTAEYRLWYELRDNRLNGYKFVRQFPIGPYFADFACRSTWLIIELDGSQHAESAKDAARTAYLNAHGWSVLRFWNDEVLRDRRAVCETILAVLEGRITEGCDGAGLFDGLRFVPRSPSPAALRLGRAAGLTRPSDPSPDSGEGTAPLRASLEPCP